MGRTPRHAFLLLVPILGALVAACSTAATSGSNAAPSAAPPTSTGTTAAPATSRAPLPDDVTITDASFVNVHDMTAVRGFFVTNLAGRLEETLAVANDPKGGIYPVGTVIQLVPQEAMVKRKPDFSPGYGDWEFFTLEPSATGTKITSRGGPEVVNRFGHTSCANCHVKAEDRYDMICEKNHGCDPLPVKDEVFKLLQDTDPRPRRGATTGTTR